MKKAISIILAFSMILTLFTGCGKSDKDNEVAEINVAMTAKEILDKQLKAAFDENESFSGGTGTEKDPWLISTADDLFRLAAQINGETQGYVYREAHYRLTGNIDLGNKNWMPIGVGETFSRYGFCGVFDGDGYTVSGMRAIHSESNMLRAMGLFGSVRGTVKNLTVAASELNTTRHENDIATGTVAGNLDAGGILQNCHAAADVCVRGGYKTGGIVGNCRGMITDCTNAASVSVDSEVGAGGGVAGSLYGSPKLDSVSGIIRNCSNTGPMVSIGGDIGGIIGLMMGEAEVTGCTNTGSVSGGENTGGIVGILHSSVGTVADCSNSGSVAGKEACGGIVGTASGGGILVLNNCTNFADVTEGKYLGGITGMFMSSSQDMSLDIIGCTNGGDMYGNDAENIANAGGILGFAMAMGGKVNLENSTNTGNIDGGKGNSGGILGGYLSSLGGEKNTMMLTIGTCDNSGNVSGGSFGVGGIVGDIDASSYPAVTFRVEDCRNTGSLYARDTNVQLGGIVGTIEPHHCISLIKNCHNSGSMTCDKTELAPGDAWFPFKSAMGGVLGYAGVSGIAPDIEDDCGLGDQVVVTISGCSNTGSFDTNDTDIPVSTDDICAMSAVGLEIE